MPGKSELLEQPAQSWAIPPAHLRTVQGWPALSDLELVEALLKFANDGSVRARMLLQSGAGPGEALLAQWDAKQPRKHPDCQGAIAMRSPDGTVVPAYQPGQVELREALAFIAAGDVPPHVRASWRRRAAGVVLLPEFAADGVHRYRYAHFESYASEPQPQIAFALMLLLECEFRNQVCRCKWERCGRFFLAAAPKGGRGAPIREYCPDTDHRDQAHQATAAERMRRSRERARERARAKQSKRRRS